MLLAVGSGMFGDALLLAAGVCVAVCGLIVLSDWRDLRARLASWATEVDVWAIASKPWVARSAGAVLLGGGVLLVVLAARKLA